MPMMMYNAVREAARSSSDHMKLIESTTCSESQYPSTCSMCELSKISEVDAANTSAHLFIPFILSISAELYCARPLPTSTSSQSPSTTSFFSPRATASSCTNLTPWLSRDVAERRSVTDIMPGIGDGGTDLESGSREAIDEESDRAGWMVGVEGCGSDRSESGEEVLRMRGG